MKELFLIFGNYFLFLLSAALLITFQNSLWFQVVGSFPPPPHMWMPILIYWTLYRKPRETLIMTYLLTFLISNSTVMPLSLLLLVNLFLTGIGYYLKLHIYWSSIPYFILLSASGTLLLPMLYFLVSWLLGEKTFQDPHVFEWIIKSLLTALISFPLYKLFLWFDSLTHKILSSEIEEVSF